MEHSLTCSHGGFRFLRHNEIRDLTAMLSTKVYPNVRIEPELQPLTGEILSLTSANREDSSRLDIQVQGFWEEQRQDTLFDVRVFNPHTSINHYSSLETCYTGSTKKRKEDCMTNVSGRWNEAPVLPWCSLPQEAWAQLHRQSTSDWQA